MVVGPEKSLLRKKVLVKHLNWILFDKLEAPYQTAAKIRYQAEDAAVTVIPSSDDPDAVWVEFHEPQKAPTPGQSIVFYDGDIVVGGGIIERAD